MTRREERQVEAAERQALRDGRSDREQLKLTIERSGNPDSKEAKRLKKRILLAR